VYGTIKMGYLRKCPFIGPEPACGISAGIIKKALRE
jgi:hypothetical protein